jgi:hypothetical protein
MKRGPYNQNPEVLMDHWKLSKNNTLNSSTGHMKGFLTHWKLNNGTNPHSGLNHTEEEEEELIQEPEPCISSIYSLVNSSDEDVVDDFEFSNFYNNETQEDEEVVMETPPNQRRFSQPRKPLPKKNTAIMEFQAFTAAATAPKSVATGMHRHSPSAKRR